MYTWDYNLFIGDDTVDVHVAFATSENLFIIGELHSSDEGYALKDVLDSLKTGIISHPPTSLGELVSKIDTEVETLGDRLAAFALVFVVDRTMYVVTRGSGEVYIERQGTMQKLLSGNNTASGAVMKGDYFLLANRTFLSGFEESALQNLLAHTKPQEVIETITPKLKGSNNVGMIALFMQAQEVAVSETADTEPLEDDNESEYVGAQMRHEEVVYGGALPPDPVYGPHTSSPAPEMTSTQHSRKVSLGQFIARMQSGSSKSKKLTFGVVVILLVVLAWSVVSGNSRRQKAAFAEEVATQKQVIEGKMSEAERLAGLNPQKSLQLIDEARQIVSTLQQEALKKKIEADPGLAELSDLIAATEQGIKKTEKGTYEEFYDLDLIEKGAGATAMFDAGDELALLDAAKGKLYVLNVAEKSVETYSASQIRKASRVSMHQGEPYFFGQSIGVYKFTETQKAENVIPPESEWGAIKDFWMYSGNIYLLDSGKGDIHKYLVAEEGYSQKRSYFGEGGAAGLTGADAMAIDSSVYVVAGTKALKYVSGSKDSFSVSIPDESDVTFDDVFASPDTDNIYLLDADTQRIFVTSKDGQFDKQISAAITKDADDFVVHVDEGILILADDKLHKIKE